MAGDAVREPGNGLDLEYRLGFSRERDGRLKGVRNSVRAEETQQIGRVLVNDEGGTGNMDPEAVREEVLSVLQRAAAVFTSAKGTHSTWEADGADG